VFEEPSMHLLKEKWISVSSWKSINFDGFVKSPSAALRFTFVVAAYRQVHFPPQLLRALHMELFTLPSQF
jgi:hypothetical protein